jgi:hypothetical protein
VEASVHGYRHRRRRAKKLRRRAAALGILGAIFLAGAAPARGAATGASVTPNADLSNGDTVTVKWTDGSGPFNIFQCAQPPSSRTCAVNDGLMNVALSPSGEGTAQLTVRAGPIGDNGGGACPGPANDCVIVINEAGSEDPGENVLVPISFNGATSPQTPEELARTGPLHLGLALTGGGAMLAGLVLVKLVEVPASVPAVPVPQRRGWCRSDDDILYRRRRYQPKHRRRR